MEDRISDKNYLKNTLKCNVFTIKKLFPKKDTRLFEELTAVYNKNYDHLYMWHRNNSEFSFNNKDELLNYLFKNKVLCFVLMISGKVIGFIGITNVSKDRDSIYNRHISYWIDKENARKGIMFNAISLLEKTSLFNNTHYLETSVYSENIASIKLLEKLKFKKGRIIFDCEQR